MPFDGPAFEETIWLVTHRNFAGAPTVCAVSHFMVELFEARRGRSSGMECSPKDP